METQELRKEYSRQKSKSRESDATESAPVVFAYIDYRKFLRDFYIYKKKMTPSFSLATFAAKAGLQTRNYFKRVADGERSLSVPMISKFCNALGFSPKERNYFEVLVHFNQSKDLETKKHYFSILKDAIPKNGNHLVEILAGQMEIFSDWYFLAVRELVTLDGFSDNPTWIAKKLKSRVTKKQAARAMQVLEDVGLIKRQSGQWIQTEPLIRYSQDVVNMAVRGYHKKSIDQAKVAIDEDDFDTWNLRSLNLAIDRSDLKKLQLDLDDFFKALNLRYTQKISTGTSTRLNSVVQLNAQMIEITNQDGGQNENSK